MEGRDRQQYRHSIGGGSGRSRACLRDAGPAVLRSGEGDLWILGDYVLFKEDNLFYSEEVKDYLRWVSNNAAYVGRDKKTFVIRVRRENAADLQTLPEDH